MANFPTTPGAAPLALRPKDAAKSLGIGQRKLWELTSPRGPIPCARIGTCIVYPVDALRAWLAAASAGLASVGASGGPASTTPSVPARASANGTPDGSARTQTPASGKGGPTP